MRTPSPLLTLAAAGVLGLTACSGDDDVASPGQLETSESTEASSPSPLDVGEATTAGGTTTSPTTSPATDATGDSEPFCSVEPALDHVEHVEFAHPDGWQIEEGNCEFFDAELEELPEDTEVPAAISVRTTDTPFHEAAGDSRSLREDARFAGAVSGYQAVRILGESTAHGLRPKGQPVLLYLVDLDPGTDAASGALVMSATPTDGTPFGEARAALDRMAQRTRVVPAAVERPAPMVVTRTERGGDPFTVTYEESCFQLRPGGPTDAVTQERCDLDPTSDDLVAGFLGDEVVVGHAPAQSALVVSDAASAPYGAFPSAVEGGALFAYEAAAQPLDVRAVDAEGEVLATTTIGS